MSKIINAEDILADARSCVQCIFLAAADLGDETDPIQTVANIADRKIGAAIALLDEYRTDIGSRPAEAASQVPDAPSAEPVSRAARPKRGCK